jgi:glycosyltransferase involved in cell wall biosynthesis
MKILMCSAQTFIPQTAGGAQTSTDELARELIARGDDVAILAGLDGSGWLGLRNRWLIKLGVRRAPVDGTLGYPAYRTWFPFKAIDEVVDRFRPNVALLPTWQAMDLARGLTRRGVPVVIYLRDVEFGDLGGDLRELQGVRYIANSSFTAGAYRAAFGIEPIVVPPLFDAARYRVQSTRRHVTFVNPDPLKGLGVALAMAEQCPDIPFCFVEGWALTPEKRADLMRRIGALPNVTWKARTQDMRTVYGDTRILLAPSRWEEAWGRVVSEAHFSGIPVLASSRGGLPESVGPGGLLVDADAPTEAWVSALRLMWDDAETYRRLSEAALAYAGRPLLNKDTQIEMVSQVLFEAAGSVFAARTVAPVVGSYSGGSAAASAV